MSPNGSGEYLAYCPESALLLHQRQFDRLRAMEAATGKVLWEKPFRTCYAPIMVGPQAFYALQEIKQIHVAGSTVTCHVYDIRTGARVRENVFRSEQFGCNYSHGTAHLLLRRDCFASWIDMASGDVCLLGNVRSGCTTSLIPAAGLVVAHGTFNIIDVGVPVELSGLRVQPGDLIHGDASGVTTIPLEIADKVYEQCMKVRERELGLRDYAHSREFTLDGLRAKLLGK